MAAGETASSDAAASATTLRRLVERFDPSIFDLGRPQARIRVEGADGLTQDVLIQAGRARVLPAHGGHADAVLRADPETWRAISEDVRGGMEAFRRGRLQVRRDLNLGVGFLAATASATGEGRLRIRSVPTAVGTLSVMEAGSGFPVLMLHGLGATKASFLPTVGALAGRYRTIAVDLPGFGDSTKPLLASYDPAYFARAVLALMDALELERSHVVGNSMGGRVAIEVGLREPARVGRLGLLTPSLAWLRGRTWAPYLRLVPTQLGALQPAPRPVVEGIVRRVVPGADRGWAAAGVDEFLRTYLTPRGRAAFYAAARNIYLEEPHGPRGFWTRLPSLSPPALFVWGRRDVVVPIAFARHVREALPQASHVELDCGHVPQLERPRETHDALSRFLAEA